MVATCSGSGNGYDVRLSRGLGTDTTSHLGERPAVSPGRDRIVADQLGGYGTGRSATAASYRLFRRIATNPLAASLVGGEFGR